MSIKNFYFYKYICISAFCGLISVLFSDICWYLLNENHLIEESLLVPFLFITAWVIGGIVSWIILSKIHNLAISSYLISIVVFILIGVCDEGFKDPSIRGWYGAAFWGYAIASLPAYYLNSNYLIPKFLNIHGQRHRP